MACMQRAISDEILECILQHIDDARDRAAMSAVCRRWYELDALTRKHVTIAFCYAVTPARLLNRFPNLESLKIKGKPRASMFNLIPENWGGYARPWVEIIAESFPKLNSLHFRRMIVADSDLETIADAKGRTLKALRLDKCSGFSTDGLLQIARSCRNLRTLYMEECNIFERDGEWLHELAANNTVLETLNFHLTYLEKIKFEDIELIARNCPLVCLKITECEVPNLINILRSAVTLEEFGGGSFSEQVDPQMHCLSFPASLHSLCMTYLGKDEMPLLFPFGHLLRKLDLMYALLSTEEHCELLRRCPNLEVLEVRNVIGDQGLETVSIACKKLNKLRIEHGDDEQGMEDELGMVTQKGLIAVSLGCPEINYLAVYVSDVTNEALETIGLRLKNLHDFRLVLLDHEEKITDLPLDRGVRALLLGCKKLTRFAFYARKGGLSDLGLSYIGQCSENVKWMLLGYVGQSDEGFLAFSRGCPSLQRLEVRGCFFSERAIAQAALQLRSLKYLWVQGYTPSTTGNDLLAMARPFWNIELIPGRLEYVDGGHEGQARTVEFPDQILAYYSLAGQRTDFPEDQSVIPLVPPEN
ncbi:Coronatine-insensitive protein 1 [Ancistrocladus abbreviatus]